MIGQHPTTFYAIAEEKSYSSMSAILKHAKTESNNITVQSVYWKTKNTITKEYQLSKSSRQQCKNGKNLQKTLSRSNQLLTLTILNTNLSSSTLITRACSNNLDKM